MKLGKKTAKNLRAISALRDSDEARAITLRSEIIAQLIPRK